ncbi:MAG: glycerol-3-phosphate acyltransferase, partial [Phycisphaerales bacterium]|nr:glycerol-3-phosphate acyltransferase [Phycisphaerales bacterium]
IWMLTLRIWRYVGLSSCIAAIALPMLAAGVFEVAGSWRAAWPYLTVTALIAVIVTYKHRGNLRRAFAGTERRFGEREKPPADADDVA